MPFDLKKMEREEPERYRELMESVDAQRRERDGSDNKGSEPTSSTPHDGKGLALEQENTQLKGEIASLRFDGVRRDKIDVMIPTIIEEAAKGESVTLTEAATKMVTKDVKREVEAAMNAVTESHELGSERFVDEVKARLGKVALESVKEAKEVMGERKTDDLRRSEGVVSEGADFKSINVSTLDGMKKEAGALCEETFGRVTDDNMRHLAPDDIILSKMLGVPAYNEDGTHICAEFPWLDEMIDNQERYLRRAPIKEFFSPTSEMGRSWSLTNRRSRWVRIPRRRLPFLPLSVIGRPEMSLFCITSTASDIFCLGLMVTGSMIIPLSNFLTFSTSSTCRSIERFR